MNAHKDFWNSEYSNPEHLALSTEPAEDLKKFSRWMERNGDPVGGLQPLFQGSKVIDFGCGNGRNLIYLVQEFGLKGIGYDISEEAIAQAKRAGAGLPITFKARSIAGTFDDIEDESCDLVLDMMTSHFLKEKEREVFLKELVRILKPAGWVFLKTFLADGDLHAKRLIEEAPADEPGAYIHPRMGVYEHVWTEKGLLEFFEKDFIVKKIEKSHKHMMNGKAFKRRTVSVYLERRW